MTTRRLRRGNSPIRAELSIRFQSAYPLSKWKRETRDEANLSTMCSAAVLSASYYDGSTSSPTSSRFGTNGRVHGSTYVLTIDGPKQKKKGREEWMNCSLDLLRVKIDSDETTLKSAYLGPWHKPMHFSLDPSRSLRISILPLQSGTSPSTFQSSAFPCFLCYRSVGNQKRSRKREVGYCF